LALGELLHAPLHFFLADIIDMRADRPAMPVRGRDKAESDG
jgi:hypothetical protein